MLKLVPGISASRKNSLITGLARIDENTDELILSVYHLPEPTEFLNEKNATYYAWYYDQENDSWGKIGELQPKNNLTYSLKKRDSHKGSGIFITTEIKGREPKEPGEVIVSSDPELFYKEYPIDTIKTDTFRLEPIVEEIRPAVIDGEMTKRHVVPDNEIEVTDGRKIYGEDTEPAEKVVNDKNKEAREEIIEIDKEEIRKKEMGKGEMGNEEIRNERVIKEARNEINEVRDDKKENITVSVPEDREKEVNNEAVREIKKRVQRQEKTMGGKGEIENDQNRYEIKEKELTGIRNTKAEMNKGLEKAGNEDINRVTERSIDKKDGTRDVKKTTVSKDKEKSKGRDVSKTQREGDNIREQKSKGKLVTQRGTNEPGPGSKRRIVKKRGEPIMDEQLREHLYDLYDDLHVAEIMGIVKGRYAMIKDEIDMKYYWDKCKDYIQDLYEDLELDEIYEDIKEDFKELLEKIDLESLWDKIEELIKDLLKILDIKEWIHKVKRWIVELDFNELYCKIRNYIDAILEVVDLEELWYKIKAWIENLLDRMDIDEIILWIKIKVREMREMDGRELKAELTNLLKKFVDDLKMPEIKMAMVRVALKEKVDRVGNFFKQIAGNGNHNSRNEGNRGTGFFNHRNERKERAQSSHNPFPNKNQLAYQNQLQPPYASPFMKGLYANDTLNQPGFPYNLNPYQENWPQNYPYFQTGICPQSYPYHPNWPWSGYYSNNQMELWSQGYPYSQGETCPGAYLNNQMDMWAGYPNIQPGTWQQSYPDQTGVWEQNYPGVKEWSYYNSLNYYHQNPQSMYNNPYIFKPTSDYGEYDYSELDAETEDEYYEEYAGYSPTYGLMNQYNCPCMNCWQNYYQGNFQVGNDAMGEPRYFFNEEDGNYYFLTPEGEMFRKS